MSAITSHKKQRAKYQSEMLSQSSNSGQEVKLQIKFPVKNDPDGDTDKQTFNCDNADRHSQTWQSKKLACKLQNSKDKQKNKTTRSALRLCLHTVAIV